MRIGSLFSGAGGLDMAVEQVFGGHTVWHSEIDKAASKVLAHRWPGVPNLGDISAVDWTTVPPVDILCGGFPCQDVSMAAAGIRRGLKDGTRSGLWSVFATAIDALRPSLVVIENVRGLLSATAHRNVESDDAVMGDESDRPVLRALGAVLGDLADIGYDAQWTTLAASSVGAPHRRERVFIIASDPASRRQYFSQNPRAATGRQPFSTTDQCRAESLELLPTLAAGNFNDGESPESWSARQATLKQGFELPLAIAVQLLSTPNASDCSGGGMHPDSRYNADGLRHSRQLIDDVKLEPHRFWDKYWSAIRRWEALTGSAPAPTQPNRNGKPRLNPAFSEWMMGWPAGWVTDPDIGISRNDQLKIVGNGVCPQQAVAALRYLLQIAVAA